MLALIDELRDSRLEVDETLDGVAFATLAKNQDLLSLFYLNKEQVEVLYTQLGRWLGNQKNPFVSDAV